MKKAVEMLIKLKEMQDAGQLETEKKNVTNAHIDQAIEDALIIAEEWMEGGGNVHLFKLTQVSTLLQYNLTEIDIEYCTKKISELISAIEKIGKKIKWQERDPGSFVMVRFTTFITSDTSIPVYENNIYVVRDCLII